MTKKLGPIQKTLTKARSYIIKGWGKGAYYNNLTKCYCTDGALGKAQGSFLGGCTGELDDFFVKHGLSTYKNVLNIVAWNDARGRTKKHVLAAFDRAIAAAKRLEV